MYHVIWPDDYLTYDDVTLYSSHMILDTWYLTLVLEMLLLDTWYLTLDIWHRYLTPDSWHLMSNTGTWHVITWHLIPDIWYMTPDNWHAITWYLTYAITLYWHIWPDIVTPEWTVLNLTPDYIAYSWLSLLRGPWHDIILLPDIWYSCTPELMYPLYLCPLHCYSY